MDSPHKRWSASNELIFGMEKWKVYTFSSHEKTHSQTMSQIHTLCQKSSHPSWTYSWNPSLTFWLFLSLSRKIYQCSSECHDDRLDQREVQRESIFLCISSILHTHRPNNPVLFQMYKFFLIVVFIIKGSNEHRCFIRHEYSIRG